MPTLKVQLTLSQREMIMPSYRLLCPDHAIHCHIDIDGLTINVLKEMWTDFAASPISIQKSNFFLWADPLEV